MTTIIHAGGFSFKAKGAFLHGVAPKLSNGLIRNGHHVINFSDRDVARASSLFGHRKFGIGGANRALRRLCRDVAPEVLLLGHADVIRPATIAAIRADLPKIRVLQWNVDPIYEPDNVGRIRSKLDVVDATLVSTAGTALNPVSKPGKLLGFLPNPVDFSIERGRNDRIDDLPADLFFAVGGRMFPRVVDGQEWLVDDLARRILAAVPGLRTSFHGFMGNPHVTGAAYQAALESAAMGLNISRRNDLPLYSSDRLAQMIGNGLLIFIDRATGYGRLFGETEMAFFSTVDELIDKIRHYAASPSARQEAATAGRSRYHELFNEQRVARYVLEVAFGTIRPEDYPWPTLV